MRGINKVILIGNTGKDTEYKTLQDGTPVAKLTIATT
jgi:single-stranded DNA-binding protein